MEGLKLVLIVQGSSSGLFSSTQAIHEYRANTIVAGQTLNIWPFQITFTLFSLMLKLIFLAHQLCVPWEIYIVFPLRSWDVL